MKKILTKVVNMLEKIGLSDKLESVGKTAKFCDYAIIVTFLLILWSAYIQIYYPTRPPLSFALSPLLLLLILMLFRGRIGLLQKDLVTGVRSRDTWLEIRNTAIGLVLFMIIQLDVFCVFFGDNLSKILCLIISIFSILSVINICTCPSDKSETYDKTLFMKSKYTRKIINKLTSLSDH